MYNSTNPTGDYGAVTQFGQTGAGLVVLFGCLAGL